MPPKTASPISLAGVPASLKPVAHFLKAAAEHENRDPVVTYWCRLAALQSGLQLDKKSKEALALLMPLMDWLEKEKKVLSSEETVTSEIVASAYLENYGLKLFGWADKEDRAARFNKNVVKAFYTAGILFDVLQVVLQQPLSPENQHVRKYAKWKAAHIHGCLKSGQAPTPGPVQGFDLDDGEDDGEGLEGRPREGHEDDARSSGTQDWLTPQIPALPSKFPDGATASGRHPAAPVPSGPTSAAGPSGPPAQPWSGGPGAGAAAGVAPAALPRATSSLAPDVVTKAQKYCKYASSALDYDDASTAIQNLSKALNLLQTGHE